MPGAGHEENGHSGHKDGQRDFPKTREAGAFPKKRKGERTEHEKKRERAREMLAESEEKEQNVSKAVHRIAPRAGSKEFLASGWVVLHGKNSKVEGTHKLMKGNRTLFYLSSEQVELDQFVKKRVGIRGYKKELDVELGADLIQVTEIRVLSP